MKKAGVFAIGAFALLVAVGAYAMGDLYVSGTWRYKMTVAVETPEGIKTGSAVRELSNSRSGIDLNWPHVVHTPGIKGEAVVIDLGKRGVLFSLISWESYKDIPSAFQLKEPRTVENIRHYNEHLKAGMKSVLTKDMPRFVYFKDLKDPQSVQAIDRNDLAATFGDGVRLQKIEIEITDKPVSITIDGILPWLNNIKANLDGTTITRSGNLSNTLHVGDFRRVK